MVCPVFVRIYECALSPSTPKANVCDDEEEELATQPTLVDGGSRVPSTD